MQFRAPKVSPLRFVRWLALIGVISISVACSTTSRHGRWPHSAWVEEADRAEPAIDDKALLSGELVERPMVLQKEGRRYVGGMAYQVVASPAHTIYSALHDGEVIEHVLPKTKDVKVLSREASIWRVELLQGNHWLEFVYSVVFREAPVSPNDPETRFVEFWLEPSRPHDVEDLWGFFAVQKLDAEHSLVTIGALVDVGPGLARLFERRLQQLILSTPRYIRSYFEGAHVANTSGALPLDLDPAALVQ